MIRFDSTGTIVRKVWSVCEKAQTASGAELLQPNEQRPEGEAW